MLRTLVRIWRTWRPPPAPRPAPSARPGAERAVIPAVAADPDGMPPLAIGARRPLIDRRGNVGGFEFRITDGTLARLRARPDGAAATAHTRALCAAMRVTAQGGRLAYSELPSGWLLRPELAQDMAAGCMVVVPAIDVATPFDRDAQDAVAALRAAGVRVGWGLAHAQTISPDFFVVVPGDDLAAATRSGIPVLASDVDTVEALEAALQAGALYACCSIDRHQEPRDAQPLSPQVRRLCQLLNRLVQDADTRPIVSHIKADVGLTYRLLHHLNMAGVGDAREVDTVEQAVLLLGRNELYRWLSMLLIRCAAVRPASNALQEMALARGRLLELLARDRGEPAPGSLFTLGVASMFGQLLRVPLAEAIEPLSLPEPARQALLAGSGPWQPYLALLAEVENPQSTCIETLAEGFGGIAHVLGRVDTAWQWATEAVGPPTAPGGLH